MGNITSKPRFAPPQFLSLADLDGQVQHLVPRDSSRGVKFLIELDEILVVCFQIIWNK